MSARDARGCGAVLVFSFLFSLGILTGNLTPLHAQTATVTSFGSSTADDFTGLIQAGDGNFYGVSAGGAAADWGCSDNPANDCTFIDQITPAGVVTQLYTFERAPGDNTTPFDANQLIEGSDGFLYGTTLYGGPGGYGTIFRLTNSGVFTVLYSFPGDLTNGPTNGYSPGPLTQGEDGNFYGLAKSDNGFYFFSMTTGGVVTILHQAAGTDGGISTDSGSLLQGSDGNFYTSTTVGLMQITPSGAVTNVVPYTLTAAQWNAPTGPLVEGADFNYYGTSPYTTYNSDGSSGGNGAIYKLSTTGTIQALYTLSGGTDGYELNADLMAGSDGNLYGSTYYGGNPACPSNIGTLGISGCGTIFEIGTSGGFHSLYAFSGTANDGGRPVGPMVQDANGNFNGTTFANLGKDIFVAAITPSIPAAIQLSFNPKTVAPGTSTTLTWSVLNAFSRTLRQCHATIEGLPTGAGSWSGAQLGTFPNNGNVYTGTATITPTIPGTYTYALTCGGRESGYATLVVNDQLNVPAVLPNGLVSAAYVMPADEFNGDPPYTTVVTSGSTPPGLTLNSATGVFQGTPTQFGTYTFGLQVTDSNSPKVVATGTTTLTIKSSLVVTTAALPSATLATKYSQTLAATGGIAPYTWSVTGGTLPAGIQLAAATGILSGTPTKQETQSVTFQVTDSEGTPATATATLTLTVKLPAPIAGVEFTQAIQQYQSLADLETSLDTNFEPPVPIIAGKPAVMRIYYTPQATVTHYTLSVTGVVSQTLLLTALPACQPADQRARNGFCTSQDIYFTPPPGAWSVNLTVDDSSGNQVENDTLTVASRNTETINLKSVSACDLNPAAAKSPCGDPTTVFSNSAFLASIMPTSNVTLQPSGNVVKLDSLTYLGLGIPEPWSAWEWALVNKINAFYTPADQSADFTANQRTTYFGIYNGGFDQGAISMIGGNAALAPGLTVVFGSVLIEDSTIAHETGHTLSLLHTNVPVPTPAKSSPGCWSQAEQPGSYWTYATNNIQSSAGPEYGFDVVNKKLVYPANTYDIMSYCNPRWISPIQYKRAITALGGSAVLSPSGGSSKPVNESASPTNTPANPLAGPTLTTGTYLQVGGNIGSTGVAFNPVFTQTLTASNDPGTGTYSIVLVNAANQPLYTRQFTPLSIQADASDYSSPSENPAFSEWVPQTAGATAINILDPNKILIGSLTLGGTPPTVTITSPVAGFVGSSQQTVSWTVQDPTSTTFNARVFYSKDNGTTWIQVGETQTTSDTIDFTQVPGSSTALIRVEVSDGINTGSATSVPFTVSKKVPSTIVINTPTSGSIQLATDPVYLTGVAYDVDDGILQGTALQWSDNIQGALGTGSSLTAKLQAGSHTITLAATDSDGNAISTTTNVTIAGGPPTVTLSTANGSGSCINATVAASPGSSEASLSLVQYSLDGGNTYTPISTSQLPYTFQVPGTGTITLVAAALDASGQVGAQSSVINLGTGCQTSSTIVPTVTVTPSQSSITSAQALSVTIGVSGGSGNPTPTGSVTLASGTYTSAATALTNGSATVNIGAGVLPIGPDTLTATYSPDSASSSTYSSGTGSNSVTVSTVSSPVQITVGTSPAGLSFSVDGTNYTAPQTLSWIPGSTHTIATASPQSNGGTQNTFVSWSDSGSISHSVTTPSSAANYTATFNTSYQLTTVANPAADGTVSPATGAYYASGAVVSVVATPNQGFNFVNWTGNVASASNASTTVTMSAPQAVTANFSAMVVTAPVASLTPSTLSFASRVGLVSAPQTATLSNTGNAPLAIAGITIVGANPGDFAVTTGANACGSSLSAGSTCSIYVTFTPASATSFAATLSVADNATGSPHTATLSGTGTAAPSFTISSPTSAQTIQSGASAQYAISVTPQNGAFTNVVTFSVTGLPTGATAIFSPPSLTPGNSPANSTLTIQTADVKAATVSRHSAFPLAVPVLSMVGLLFVPGKRRRRMIALCILLCGSLGAFTTLTACGSFTFNATKTPITYTVTVNATSGSLQQSTTVQLTVN